jgi:Zn-dependent oligopeptidase
MQTANAVSAAQRALQEFISSATNVASQIAAAQKNATSAITTANFDPANSSFSNPLASIASALKGVNDAISTAQSIAQSSSLPVLQQAVTSLPTALQLKTQVDTATTGLNTVQSIIQDMQTANAVSAAQRALQEFIGSAADAVSQITAAQSAATSALNNAKIAPSISPFIKILADINSALKAVNDAITAAQTATKSSVLADLQNAVGALPTAATLNGYITTATTGLDAVTNAIQQIQAKNAPSVTNLQDLISTNAPTAAIMSMVTSLTKIASSLNANDLITLATIVNTLIAQQK